MRKSFTIAEAEGLGYTPLSLRWAVDQGRVHRLARGLFVEGEEPDEEEAAAALVSMANGVSAYFLAGLGYNLNSVRMQPPFGLIPPNRKSTLPGIRRAHLDPSDINDGSALRRTTPVRTLLDLAAVVDDLAWEQMLESALRKQLCTVKELEERLLELKASRRKGVSRVRRVLALRPSGAPPTESLLETLAVQMIRSEPRLPTPERQVVIHDRRGRFVARVDLAYPDHGVFLELDGEHHKDQPVHDAARQTDVVIATGWHPARFTWTEVTRVPRTTSRRLLALLEGSRISKAD